MDECNTLTFIFYTQYCLQKSQHSGIRARLNGNQQISNLNSRIEWKNYHSWAIKMKAYLRAMNLWDVIEKDENPTLPHNPTVAQIKRL